MLRIGVISDTHNLLRPEALAYLRGSDHIIHAGDVCDPKVLEELRGIAPLTVVRGNNDRGDWAETVPHTEIVKLGQVFFYVVHDIADMNIDPVSAGISVVVSGHSHQPAIIEKGPVLYLNPGSAGPRRFKLPVSAGQVIVQGGLATASTALRLASAA